MAPFKSLYDSLLEQGLIEPEAPVVVTEPPLVSLTGKQFAEAVLRSEEFRLYVVEGLTDKTIPSAILCRLIDHGWGKPPDRIEHTGKDGNPIETITEVRRVIVRTNQFDEPDTTACEVTH